MRSCSEKIDLTQRRKGAKQRRKNVGGALRTKMAGGDARPTKPFHDLGVSQGLMNDCLESSSGSGWKMWNNRLRLVSTG
jgi:hypothetical protein